MMKLTEKVELYIRRQRTIYCTYTRLRNRYYYTFYPEIRGKLNIVNKKTDLCIEGFPRSGNTFLVNLIKSINPDLRLASHKHSSGHVKEAVRIGVPTIVMVRDPSDAITSKLIRSSKDRIEPSQILKTIQRYIQYYTYIEATQSQLMVIEFQSLIGDTPRILEDIGMELGLWQGSRDYMKIATAVMVAMKTKQINENIYKSCAPSKVRDERKNEVKKRLLEEYLDELTPANSIYEKITFKRLSKKADFVSTQDKNVKPEIVIREIMESRD